MKRYVVLFAVVLSVVCLRAALVQPPLPQDGPWNSDLYLLVSSDGLRFGQPQWFTERAGVPTVVRDGKGRLVAAFQGFRSGPRADRAMLPPPTPPRGVAQPMGGPYTHRVLSATSQDGLRWTRDEGVRMEHASVPCAVADGDRILLY